MQGQNLKSPFLCGQRPLYSIAKILKCAPQLFNKKQRTSVKIQVWVSDICTYVLDFVSHIANLVTGVRRCHAFIYNIIYIFFTYTKFR